FQAEDGIRAPLGLEFRRVLFRSFWPITFSVPIYRTSKATDVAGDVCGLRRPIYRDGERDGPEPDGAKGPPSGSPRGRRPGGPEQIGRASCRERGKGQVEREIETT